MLPRVIASLGVLALWLIVYLAFRGDLPTLAEYVQELHVNSYADSLMQAMTRDHMQIPAVLSFMAFAMLWAPVIERKLSKE